MNRVKRNIATGVCFAVLALTLTGCAGAPTPDDPAAVEGAPADDTVAPDAELPDEDPPLDLVADCAQIEPYIATYIDGLVPDADNDAGEWGASCGWGPAEDAGFEDIRTVDVQITSTHGEEATPLEGLATMEGFAEHDRPALRRVGGVAYSLTAGSAAVGGVVATVWTPVAEVAIVGGQWGEYPALTGEAATDAAIALLGL